MFLEWLGGIGDVDDVSRRAGAGRFKVGEGVEPPDIDE